MNTSVEMEEAELARRIREAERQIASLDPQLIPIRLVLEDRLSHLRRRRAELAALNAAAGRGEG